MIRWGIIGAGNIAHRFARSLACEEDAVLYAASGRNEEKMRTFQKECHCEKVYIGHDHLLEDEKVDAVYIALPHNLHKEWILKSLYAGKAVLCEKPAVMNAEEMKEAGAAAEKTGLLFMEAMKPRFVPAWNKIRDIIERGEIGTVVSVKAENCFKLPEEMYDRTYHTKPGVGGALLDSGCYGVNWLNAYLKGNPVVIKSECIMRNGVDMYSDTILQFENGTGELIAGFDRNTGSHVTIEGTKGVIFCDHMHRPTEFKVRVPQMAECTYVYPYLHDDFFGEIHAFDKLLEEKKSICPEMTVEDSIRNAQIMDIIRESFRRKN